MKTNIIYVAMDTQKKQHQVAWAAPDTGEIREYTVRNTAHEIERMVKKIRKQAASEIAVCYEAGVCGFVLQRRLQSSSTPASPRTRTDGTRCRWTVSWLWPLSKNRGEESKKTC